MNKIISIIVPVFNEVNTILIVLDKLKNMKFYSDFVSQIIIIDDNSLDGTTELLKKIEKDEKFKDDIFIFKSKNSGKGDSQRLAIPLCKGELTIIQDADLEYNIENINSLIELLIKNDYDAVLGFRKLKKTKLYSPYFLFHKVAVITLTILTNLLYQSNFRDVCTCYRLIKTPILKRLDIRGERFEFDFSMINKLALMTKKIGNIQIDYTNRSFKDGKKNTWIVGFYAIKRILIDRFNF
jgi:glycosyltransferase involved in cell wall biosynthesis